ASSDLQLPVDGPPAGSPAPLLRREWGRRAAAHLRPAVGRRAQAAALVRGAPAGGIREPVRSGRAEGRLSPPVLLPGRMAADSRSGRVQRAPDERRLAGPAPAGRRAVPSPG